MYNRIIQIRKSLNLSQRQFGENLGLKQSTINEIEHKRCGINERLIISICAKYNINENWLRTGQGEMLNTFDKNINDFFNIFQKLSQPLQQFLLQTAKNLLDTQDKL